MTQEISTVKHRGKVALLLPSEEVIELYKELESSKFKEPLEKYLTEEEIKNVKKANESKGTRKKTTKRSGRKTK